ncbi:hypothetical protein GA0074692_6758 [Micromonospora pallida]|uniref:Uncharacterized protein n=1 Tax=Micromonospora pallida TaxID=145854 RepID=A0A1C6TNR0_9ACTN|nr:hypothetical protein [Micromonospora pallida]SCL43195.1 hypothetical protein GA0074692_6758 [Micromonospora pallida]
MTALVWNRNNVAARSGRCRHCGGSTPLRDDEGRPCHKVCAEQALTTQLETATAAYQTSTIGDPT